EKPRSPLDCSPSHQRDGEGLGHLANTWPSVEGDLGCQRRGAHPPSPSGSEYSRLPASQRVQNATLAWRRGAERRELLVPNAAIERPATLRMPPPIRAHTHGWPAKFHMLLSKVEVEMIVGYARVSARDKALVGQIAELEAAVWVKVYREKISGAKTDRPELRKLMRRLEEGDTVIVPRLDRLGRSTRDLLNLLAEISERGATFRSLK